MHKLNYLFVNFTFTIRRVQQIKFYKLFIGKEQNANRALLKIVQV